MKSPEKKRKIREMKTDKKILAKKKFVLPKRVKTKPEKRKIYENPGHTSAEIPPQVQAELTRLREDLARAARSHEELQAEIRRLNSQHES